ncbi:HD-GYP domain-containing protein [Rhizobium glycinendophyticum]|uniref:HD-GYP domain-containing protein n=1 Tax=Rhizobium glycinendophyticum TaxID=2589807 RepID=A0A504UUG8_9HYPH|nr:HD-GYP domain-containing protein [Rhizobium glycinendophyticum]TPP10381.1 HD-GYP domain-containing protein [Rhizobium glycinendophyticum]
MLVKLAKDRIRKGMFIESVACPSKEFAKRRFVLTSDRDMAAIARSSASKVLINVALGLDADGRAPSPSIDKRRQPKPSTSGPNAAEIGKVRGEIDQTRQALKTHLTDLVAGGPLDLADLSEVSGRNARTWKDSAVIALEVTRLKSKDETTYVHSLAVSGIMTLLGQALDIDEETVGMLGVAGMLHDIGKLLIPSEILTKPGQLTAHERDIIRHHPEGGFQLLSGHPGLPQLVLDICRLHHEALDGSGYPLGLQRDDLAMPVRLSTVCDVFEALTSVRPYKRPWTPTEALDWMFARPNLFDRKMVIRLGSVLIDTPIH